MSARSPRPTNRQLHPVAPLGARRFPAPRAAGALGCLSSRFRSRCTAVGLLTEPILSQVGARCARSGQVGSPAANFGDASVVDAVTGALVTPTPSSASRRCERSHVKMLRHRLASDPVAPLVERDAGVAVLLPALEHAVSLTISTTALSSLPRSRPGSTTLPRCPPSTSPRWISAPKKTPNSSTWPHSSCSGRTPS